MSLLQLLKYSHSGLRYVALFILIFAIIAAFHGWVNNRAYTKRNHTINLVTVIFLHLQLLIGLVLYFLSPIVKSALSDMGAAMKDSDLRFFAVEHISMMLIAILLITFGRKSAEKYTSDMRKHKKIAIIYTIGLLIIFYSIPWPFLHHLSYQLPWF